MRWENKCNIYCIFFSSSSVIDPPELSIGEEGGDLKLSWMLPPILKHHPRIFSVCYRKCGHAEASRSGTRKSRRFLCVADRFCALAHFRCARTTPRGGSRPSCPTMKAAATSCGPASRRGPASRSYSASSAQSCFMVSPRQINHHDVTYPSGFESTPPCCTLYSDSCNPPRS